MPASLIVRVSASCNAAGEGELTVELINYAAGESVTVEINTSGGGYSVEFPTESSPYLIANVANGAYTVTATGTLSGVGDVYINSGSAPFDEVTVDCTPTGGGGTVCAIIISGVDIAYDAGIEATVSATGATDLEYSIDGTTFQDSPTFTVSEGAYTVFVRDKANPDCIAQTTFVATAEDSLSVATPVRGWLPVGQDINYTFTSPNATPQPLAVRIEVSSNGINFDSPLTAGVLVIPPDNNKQYRVNAAPYLEAMFSPTNPVLSGQDFALYKRYRLVVGETPGFTGTAGTPELTTPEAFCLYATELTPIVAGFITLTKAPIGVNSSQFSGVETAVFTATNELRTRSMPYDTDNPNPEVCYQYPIQLYWLNRAGGWQTWVFDGKHEYEEETGEPVYWKDDTDKTHLAHYEGIAQKVKLFSGFIPASVFDTVYSVVSAIRVYHRDNGLWREINIEPGSYLKHKEGLKRKQLDFEFTYAQTLTVQNA